MASNGDRKWRSAGTHVFDRLPLRINVLRKFGVHSASKFWRVLRVLCELRHSLYGVAAESPQKLADLFRLAVRCSRLAPARFTADGHLLPSTLDSVLVSIRLLLGLLLGKSTLYALQVEPHAALAILPAYLAHASTS